MSAEFDAADADPNAGDALRERIVLAALPHVSFEGWSRKALAEGARSIGLAEDEARLAFPDGPGEAIACWAAWSDRQMLAELERLDLVTMRARERIATAVRIRLEVNAQHRETVRRTLSFLALPTNGALGLRTLYATVDAIWYACGDNATDVRFYTKRVLLAGIYTSAVLFWLNDDSEANVDTWEFVERRLDDLLGIRNPLTMLRDAAATLSPQHLWQRATRS